MYNVLVGKCKGRREIGRNGDRWEDNIKICLQEIEFEGACDTYGGKERYIPGC